MELFNNNENQSTKMRSAIVREYAVDQPLSDQRSHTGYPRGKDRHKLHKEDIIDIYTFIVNAQTMLHSDT